MTAKNRPEQIGKLHAELKKHFKAAPPSPGRPLMEHILYASLLEDTPADLADEGFAKCEQEYFDWNEVRVTTVTELAEVLSRLPSATAAAMRLKKNLQSIFETFYNFDIDHLKKENLGKAVAKFEAMPGISPFVLSYLVQHGLGGHAIPVDSSSMKIMMLSGVVSDTEAASGKVPGLERTIPKNRALEFSSLLHQAGIAFQANSKDKVVWDVLMAVNSDAKALFDRPKASLKSAKKPTITIVAASPSKGTTPAINAGKAVSAGKASKSAPPAAPAGKSAPDKKPTKATGTATPKPVEPPKASEKSKGSAQAAPTKTAPTTSSTASKTPAPKTPAAKTSAPESKAVDPKALATKAVAPKSPAVATASSSKTPTEKSPAVKVDKAEVKNAGNKPLSVKATAGKPLTTKSEPVKAAPAKPAPKPTESKLAPATKPLPAEKPEPDKKPASKAVAEPAKNLSAKKPTAEKAAPVKPVSTKPAVEKPKTEKPVAGKPTSKKTEEKPLSKDTADAKLTTAKTGVTSTNKKLTKQKPR